MKIAIIGAGLAGLSAAWQIHALNPDAAVDVFEATDRIGGKLYTVAFAAGPTDMGAEAYLAYRKDATEFFAELGLSESLVAPSGLPSQIYSGGSCHALPTDTVMGIPRDAASVATLVDAATAERITAEAAAPPLEWVAGETDMTVGQLVRQRFGDQIADRIVSALQGGVYSATADDLGLRATLPQVAQALDELAVAGQPVTLSAAVTGLVNARNAQPQSYNSQVFATFANGYAELYEALAEQSRARIHIDAFISSVTKTPNGFALSGAGDGVYDHVIFATPAPTTAMLLKTIAPDAVAPLKSIRLASSVVVGMKFADDTGLPDYSGILVAADEEDITAKAFTFASKKWPHLAARGGALVRASFGRFGDDAITRADEDYLVDCALDDLQKITGFDGRAAGLDEIYVQRWFGGLPVFSPDHPEAVAAVTAIIDRTPGVSVTGAWCAGVGVPAVIEHARATARSVVSGAGDLTS